MNIREELLKMEKIEFDAEFDKNKVLQESFYKWLDGEKIIKEHYETILDELQRGLDENLEYEELIIYSKDLEKKRKKKTLAEMPKEFSIYRKILQFNKFFIEINDFLNKNNLESLNSNYGIEEIKNLIYVLYDNNKLEDFRKEFYNCFSKLLKNCKFIGESDFFNEEHFVNSVIINRDLNNKDYVILNDYDLFSKTSFALDREIRTDIYGNILYTLSKEYLENYGIYLHSCNSEVNCKLLKPKEYTFFDGRVYLYKHKEKFNKYLELEQVNSELYLKLAKNILSPIMNKISNTLSQLKIEDLAKSPRIDFSIWRQADINNKYLKVRELVINVFNNSFYSSINDFGVYVIKKENMSNFNVIIFYKRVFGMIKVSVYDKTTVEECKYYYLTENDSINIFSKEASKSFDFSTKSYGTPKKASVMGNAILGSAIAGGTGAMIGALTAIDKNNKIEAQKNIEHKPILYSSKYKNLYLTIVCNNIKEKIILEITNFDNVEYNGAFINKFSSLFLDNNVCINSISQSINENDLKSLDDIRDNINSMEIKRLEINKIIDMNKNALFGAKAKERKQAILELEKLENDINKQKELLRNQLTNIMSKF